MSCNGSTTTSSTNGASRVTSEILSQKRLEGSWHTYTTTTTNSYAGAGGSLSYSAASTHNSWYNGSSTTASSTSYSYVWWDEARVASSTHDSNTGSGSNPLFTSTYTYDGLGRLASVYIADGRPRTVTFTSNPNGQVLSRIESSAAAKNPADYYYFVDGVQVGELSNNGNHDLSRATYSETFVTRNWNFNQNMTSQPFRWNTTGGVTRGQFGGSGYDPISPTSQGMEGTDSRYQVREGDTLQGIAQQLFGDSSLWYMLAEANGLSGAQSLAAGTSLIVPDKVTNIHNSARTFEVYDPNRALGDLSPTAAKPPKKAGKCGMFGMIMLVVIAVAVTVVTSGAAAAAIGGVSGGVMGGLGAMAAGQLTLGVAAAAGAIGGIAGSIASQGFGVATGIQDKFSWKQVALAGISGAIGGALGPNTTFGRLGAFSRFGPVASGALRGAIGSAATQGIGVVTGLQKKFDFVGVAAAAAGGGAAGWASNKLAGIAHLNRYVAQTLSGSASAIANAATRSALSGTSFGDNLLAALPDVIGATIGNMIGEAVAGIGHRSPARSSGKNAALRQDPAEGEVIVVTRNYDPDVSPREAFDSQADAQRELELEAEENRLTGINGARIGRVVEEGGTFYVEWETVAKSDGKLRFRYAMEGGGAGTPIGIAPEGDPFSAGVNVEKLNRRSIYNEVEGGRVYVFVDEYGLPTTRAQYDASPSDFTRTLQDYGLVRSAYNHAARDPIGRANFDKFLKTDIPIILSTNSRDEYFPLNSFVV